MRVLMLSWEYPPRIVGGISRVVHDLAQKLGEHGIEVHVVTCWEEGTEEFERDKNVFVHRVHTYEINTFNFVDWVLQLNFAMIEYSIELINETQKFDIIHVHDWIVAFAGRVLKNSFSIPMISTIHATEFGRNSGLHNETQKYISSVEWWLGYESRKIIVNSQYMKNEIRNVFQIPEEKIRVIPNGVNLNKFDGFEHNLAFRRKYAADNEKIVFFVGRIVNEKGVKVLIDSVPKILNYYNDVKFIIAGKGPEMEELKEKAHNMNISNRIYFTGYIKDEDLCNLYKCADIAVFPSLYEPFGIVALEGMIANVPVVISDTGGLDEIVNHGVDGMKSYTGNSNSLADSILDILFNTEKAKKIVENAKKKVNSLYNWENIYRQILNVYKEVIKESKSNELESKSNKK